MSDTGTSAVLRQALEWHASGHGVVLATVVRTWGSAPRRAGSHMAVCDTGEFAGSVSGGCVEVAVVDEARRVLSSGAPATVEYGVADEEAWAVGLACGGEIAVRLDPVGPGDLDPELLREVLAAREARTPVVLATGLETGGHRLMGRAGRHGNGGQAGDPVSPEAVAEAIRWERSVVAEGPEGPVFLRPHTPGVRVVIVGAVHLAQALVPLVRSTGFEALVVDPRDVFATPDRFPGVELVVRWPGEALQAVAPDLRTAVVVVTHDPKLDDPALVEALASEAFYVGALGSRRTHARRLERLSARGLSAAALERIHAPVGLDIGARTPEEIAVAILAELIAALRREDGA